MTATHAARNAVRAKARAASFGEPRISRHPGHEPGPVSLIALMARSRKSWPVYGNPLGLRTCGWEPGAEDARGAGLRRSTGVRSLAVWVAGFVLALSFV